MPRHVRRGEGSKGEPTADASEGGKQQDTHEFCRPFCPLPLTDNPQDPITWHAGTLRNVPACHVIGSCGLSVKGKGQKGRQNSCVSCCLPPSLASAVGSPLLPSPRRTCRGMGCWGSW